MVEEFQEAIQGLFESLIVNWSSNDHQAYQQVIL